MQNFVKSGQELKSDTNTLLCTRNRATTTYIFTFDSKNLGSESQL